MKVLIINTVAKSGSTGKICYDLYSELKKNGHDCCLAFGRGHIDPSVEYFKIGNYFDIYEHLFESRFLDNCGLASRRATRKFLNFIEEYKPDVVNIHNIHGYYINFPLLFDYLKKNNYKIIWTFHDSWPYSSHSAYVDLQNHDKKARREILKEYPKTLGFNRSLRNYNIKRKNFSGISNLNIVTPSIWLKEELEETFFSEYNIRVINNGINREIFNCINFSKKQKKNYILGVANIWDNRKGLNYFFELASLTDHKIIIIGKMDSKNKKIISSMQSITHIEQTANQQELAKYYREALIFVNPTLQDNYPTTNLEAISCGTPVVTFDTGGSAEEINTNTGVVCKTKKTSEIILGIEKVKDNYKKNVYANLGENLNLYSKESMIEKYILLMKGINENEKNIVL